MNFTDMVLKAGFKIRDLSVLPTHEGHITPELMRLVELARAEERELCAKVCDDKHDYMCSRAAAAIRERGEK